MYDRDLLESRRVVNELERVVLWWGVTIAMGNEQIHLGAKLEPLRSRDCVIRDNNFQASLRDCLLLMIADRSCVWSWSDVGMG